MTQFFVLSWRCLRADDRGAAETSTILAWVVVGVTVVMGLLVAFTQVGSDVVDWMRNQLGI